jgi:uroporphyrinogen-III synthase
MNALKFDRATVVSFESRNAKEMARLIEKQNGIPVTAPSMRETPLADQREAFEFGERLFAGEVDCLILLTGVGLRALVDALSARYEPSKIYDALGAITLICRGPKPLLVLKQWGLTPALVAPEPNTTATLIQELDRAGIALQGKRVDIQEYGERNLELATALSQRGCITRSVAVYMWELPSDTGPLEDAVRRIVNDEIDVALFTSARQIVHLFEIADRLSVGALLLQRLQSRVVLASVGPVTSQALRERGLTEDVEPPHPKMGSFVTFVAGEWERLREKRTKSAH